MSSHITYMSYSKSLNKNKHCTNTVESCKGCSDLQKGKHNLANFRSILLLPVLSKVLEKAVHSQLVDFLKKWDQNEMSDRQFGYRRNISTNFATTILLDEITSKCRFTEPKEKSSAGWQITDDEKAVCPMQSNWYWHLQLGNLL